MQIKFKNASELSRLFNELQYKKQDNIVYGALTDSAKYILRIAKNNLRSRTNATQKHSKEKNDSKNKQYTKDKQFSVRKSRKNLSVSAGIPWYIYFFLDRGTKDRSYKIKNSKSGKTFHNTGYIKANNFFKDAVDTGTPTANKMIEDMIIKRTDKLFQKYNK